MSKVTTTAITKVATVAAGLALGAALLLVVLAGGLIWYALRPDWRTLYVNLEPEDARQTAQMLAQAQIPYEPTPDGAGILVPAAQLDKARLAVAAKGGVKSGRLGFEIFDKPNWVGSEFDEQVNYQRALEGELEHTVGSLADVESARVHLVLPHDSLFRDAERPAKASVVLKLRHRNLADGNGLAVQKLPVAGNVFNGVADGVAEVQDGPQAALLKVAWPEFKGPANAQCIPFETLRLDGLRPDGSAVRIRSIRFFD